jgi:arylsulfatase A-like enzyme
LRARALGIVGAALIAAGSGCARCDRGSGEHDASPGAAAQTVATKASVPGPDAGGDAGAPRLALRSHPWNVILITVDSLRADMPWAGYARPIAPRLGALHDRSIAYTHAYSTSSFTSKSIPGLLTGRYPSELVRNGSFFTRYLSPEQFLCTHLEREGIPCVGAHAHMYFGPNQSGFETGFQSWKIVPGISFDYQTDPYVTSQKLTPLAIETLEAVTKRSDGGPVSPFFAWFHYMDPHDEYKSHDESPHFGKRARDLYDEEVFYTDLWIGKLLDYVEAQSWAQRTVLVVTADHGEAFGEHGLSRHAHELWEELVHVPLFVYVPGAAPRTIDATRGHVDLAPTVADLLGAKNLPKLPGTSLVSELDTDASFDAGSPEERDVIVDLPEDEHNDRRRALIHGRTKLIAFGEDVRFALFDLDADPREADDLVLKRPELAAEMRRRYREASKLIAFVPPRGGIPGKER